MLQVMLTDHCNQACPYCFAKEKLADRVCTELSLENLEYLIAVHQRWGLPVMSLVGGEPTLHSRFEEVLGRIMDSGCPMIHLFTNGVVRRERADFLSGVTNLTCLVNHNPPHTYEPGQLEKLEYFLGTCAQTGLRMLIGTTVYGPNPELDFLLEAAVRFGVSAVRLGLAHPIYYKGGENVNRYLSLSECRDCSEPVVSFVEACSRAGVSVMFDCHYPLCMFTSDQLLRLQEVHPEEPPPFALDCCSQVTVRPDLSLFSCFATGGIFNDLTLSQFASIEQLRSTFSQAFAAFEETAGYPECERCPAFGRECGGGCLGQKLLNCPVPPEDIEAEVKPVLERKFAVWGQDRG